MKFEPLKRRFLKKARREYDALSDARKKKIPRMMAWVFKRAFELQHGKKSS